MSDRRAVRTGLVGCAVLVLAACGSSTSGAGAGGSSTASTGNSGASASNTPAHAGALKKIVLHSADLPAGWKGTPYKADPSDAARQAAMVKCVGVRNTDPDKVAEAHSADFALGSASISSSATSYRSQRDLDVDTALVHSPKVSGCLRKLLRSQLATSLPAGAKFTFESFKIKSGSAGGPANVIATGTGAVSVTVRGQQVRVYITVAFITGPLIEAEVDTDNVGAPLPASLVHSVVNAVAARAANG